MFTKLNPWYVAQVRISTVTFIALPLSISAEFWRVWAEVYRPNRSE